MGKKSKNHAQLANEDVERIESILVKLVKEIQKSLDKYPRPRELAIEVIRSFNSDVTRAAIFLALFSLTLNPDSELKPKYIREKVLPENIRISPRQLTEALKKVQNEGFLANVRGRPRSKRHGRPKASDNISCSREGGPRSYYVITEGLTDLKKLMSPSEASRLIHDRLKKEGIVQEYYKLFLLAEFYAIRQEGELKGKMFEVLKASAPFYISQISENDFSSWDDYVNMLRSKGDNELDLFAERLACLMAEHNPFDYFVYYLRLLPTLLNINV